MRAETIRRCLVFGVCALGVGALYLVPGLGRSSYQVGEPTLNDEPSAQPTPAVDNASASLASRRSTPTEQSTESSRSTPDAAPTASSTSRATSRTSLPASSTPHPVRTTSAPKTSRPEDRHDDEPPQPVHKITPSKVTPDQLSLSWSEAQDNVRVIGYHIWLSGFQVASTAETHATVRWFNDDTAQHVVQVKAVDAAGNEAPSSPTLLVSRPAPDSTPAPQPSDSVTSEPDPSSSPTPSDGPSQSGRAAAPSAISSAATPNGQAG